MSKLLEISSEELKHRRQTQYVESYCRKRFVGMCDFKISV